MTTALHAITRRPSRRMDSGELTHLKRTPIDNARALEQHALYCKALAECGAKVNVLADDDRLPDCAFVEDTAVVFPEIAVLCRPGAQTRRPELDAVLTALPSDRPLARIDAPATLDGGDVLVVERDVFVGRSTRTNEEGVEALKHLLQPFGYRVTAVTVPGALHLKTACTALDPRTLVINRAWVDASAFKDFDLIDVAGGEPFAANTLTVAGHVLVQAAFPATAGIIRQRGFRTIALDIGEFAKAEAGLTCMSLVYA